MNQYGSGDGGGSGSRRRRFASPATSAYLGPAFNACAAAGCTEFDGPIGVDASLLRYSRPSPYPSSNSGKMQRLMQMSTQSDEVAVLDAHEILMNDRESRSRARTPSSRSSSAAPAISSSASNSVTAASRPQQSGGSVSTAQSGVYGCKTRRVRPEGETAAAAAETAVFEFAPAAEQEYINQVLYGPSRRKRLPVFAEICPE